VEGDGTEKGRGGESGTSLFVNQKTWRPWEGAMLSLEGKEGKRLNEEAESARWKIKAEGTSHR